MTVALTPPKRWPVLADTLPLPRTVFGDAVVVAMAAALTALAAQVSFPIPGSPVPVTGQTFAVLVTGAALGPLRGLLGQVFYVVLGLVGLPVYSAGTHGWQVVWGANGGYLIGFVLAAALAGACSRRGSDRSVVKELVVMVAADLVIYAFGLPWLMHQAHLGFGAAVSAGFTPFLVGDAFKVALAAGLLPGAWMVVNRIAPRSGR